MSIALGGNQITKAYLGGNEVQKMYLGSNLVFDNIIPPAGLTPILTNFRVEDANKNRVLFDSTDNVTGLTTTGFVVHGDQTANAVWENLITGVTIDGDGLGGYFTLSKTLTFWDNHIIRLGENTDLIDVNPIVRNFTLTEIVNNIPEPTATTNRYASVSGSGSHDGTSEANAWSLTEASSQAVAGQTVWIKAGDYGNTVYEFNNDGTAANPIKFMGYTSTPGDIDYTNDFTTRFTNFGSSANRLAYIDDTTYPVLVGNNTDNGLETRNASYLIFRNIQARNHLFGFYNATNSDAIIFQNCMSGNNYESGSAEGRSFMADARYDVSRLRWIDNVGFDNSLNCMHADGEYNLIKNNVLVSGVFQSYSCDYWIAQNGGSNSMIIGNDLHRVENPSHDGHAVGFKPQPRWSDSWGTLKSQYNLVQGHTVYDISEGLLAAFDLCQHNTYKDNRFINDTGVAKECEMMVARDGSRYNVFERNSGNHLEMGALLARVDEFYPETGNEWMSLGNIFRNNLMIDPLYTIQMTHRNPNLSGTTLKIEDTYFYNNTIIRPVNLFRRSHTNGPISVIDSEFKNNIVWSEVGDNPTRYASSSEPTDYLEQYNDYYQTGWTITGVGNLEVDPSFNNTTEYRSTNDSLISAPRLTADDYDKSDRADTTTMGYLKDADEPGGVTPPVGNNKAYIFNGATNSYFTTNCDLNGLSSITFLVEARITGTASQDYNLVSTDPAATQYGLMTYDNTANKRLEGKVWGPLLSSTLQSWANDGEYHQFAYTHDQATGRNELYVDGVNIGGGTDSDFNGFTETINLQIGKERSVGVSTLDGEEKTVQVYNRALSQSELAALSSNIENTPSGLVCNFYDNKTGTTWTDDVAGYVATNQGGATLEP